MEADWCYASWGMELIPESRVYLCRGGCGWVRFHIQKCLYASILRVDLHENDRNKADHREKKISSATMLNSICSCFLCRKKKLQQWS